MFSMTLFRDRKVWLSGSKAALLLLLSMSTLAASSRDGSPVQMDTPAKRDPGRKVAPRSHSTLENLESLSVADSNFERAVPVIGQRDETAEYTRELVRVEWRATDPIYLYVILPKGVKRPPAILYLYSYPSETDIFSSGDFSRLATANGFAAVGFVSALNGHRYHDRPMRQWFISELAASLVTTVHDVQMILNYLALRGDIDMDRVGMFGAGSGATIAILAAGVEPRIRALQLLDPWGDWPDWLAGSPAIPDMERAEYLKPEFLKRVAGLDPVSWLPRLKQGSIRIDELSYDSETPRIAKEALAQAASHASRFNYESPNKLREAALSGKLYDWLKVQLRPGHGDVGTPSASRSAL